MTKSTKSTAIKKEREKTRRLKNLFIDNFFKLTGNISMICKQLKINRGTYYLWMDKDKNFKGAIDDESEGLLDFAESKLFNLINEKHPTAIIFFLKTKGRHRGYIERTEMEFQGSEKKPLRIILENANPNHRKKKD